ncbi:MAG: hypothetical protein KG028_04800 [Actinobacteria bacterium]|jgi:hypothetical protein|nr:hypothetical protein [Actinomycetota bacterium]
MIRETMTVALVLVVLASCADPAGESADGTDAVSTRQAIGDYEQVTLGDVRLWAHGIPGDGSGEGAIVSGTLGLDVEGSCLFLERDGQRFPVVWPHGTELLDDDPVRIGLSNGPEVTVGMQLEGGGGSGQAALYPFGIPDSCVSSTGEVARFNQQSPIQASG